MHARSRTEKESVSLSCEAGRKDSRKMEKAIRVAIVSISQDEEPEDDGTCLGGFRRHVQSTEGPQRRASALEKSDFVSTAGNKACDQCCVVLVWAAVCTHSPGYNHWFIWYLTDMEKLCKLSVASVFTGKVSHRVQKPPLHYAI